ncbi:hypothetical protein LB504_010047 [Fusarium proliferatum]|nr:hypothetical protein LB504_010047 [Fusarium proliferatum]
MATESDNVDCASVWGDFIGSDDEGEVKDVCKPIKRYEEGLYYPVCIGEVLIDRYRIEHKLGHSGFSTVWMAHNILNNNNDTSRLLTYLDTFLLPGTPQIYHRVLVFPLLGPSLQIYASFMSIAT